MTKAIKVALRYDGATLEQVHEMLADPAFREAVCDYQGVLGKTVTITRAGDTMDVVIDEVQRARGIPSFAQKFIGSEVNIVQAEQWSSPTKADISVAIPGKPGDITGTATLAEDADGVTETVALEVKVNIPLVGGKLEGLIADLLTRAMHAENAVGVRYLAGS